MLAAVVLLVLLKAFVLALVPVLVWRRRRR
jgi:hypothetical protein